MANIPVEKRSGGDWWKWLLGLLVAALVVWLLLSVIDGDEPELTEEPLTEQLPATPMDDAPAGTLGDILSNPDGYIGAAFPQAEVQVAEVPTDRGFWIEDQGQRLFAVVEDAPAEQPIDINPGQTIRIEEGTLRDATYLTEVPGGPLDQQTQTIAEQQEVFLMVNEENIDVLEQGTPQPGTDPALETEPAPGADPGNAQPGEGV